MKIGLHQVRNDINVFKVWTLRWVYVEDPNDIVMIKLPQNADLSQDTLGVNQVVECIGNFLNCDFLGCGWVPEGCYHSVGSTSNFSNEFEGPGNIVGCLGIDRDALGLLDGHAEDVNGWLKRCLTPFQRRAL